MSKFTLNKILICGEKFQALVDTGSSDLLIPGTGLPGYNGPTFSYYDKSPISDTASTQFADGSSWSGQFYSEKVSIGNLSVVAPFAVMKTQVQRYFILLRVLTGVILI